MSPEAFRRLADHLPQALLLLSPSGRVLAANRHARRQLSSALEGRSLPDLSADPDRFLRYLALCGRGGDALPGSLLLDGDHPDDSLRCDCSVVRPGRDEQEKVLLLRVRSRPDAAERFLVLNEQIERLHREIRLREEAEAQRERLLEQERHARAAAEEASRLKDEFLATVSHELRTPLNAIKGWVHLLRLRQDEQELLRRGLETIEKNTDAQSQLVEDLLDVSRIITGRIRLSVRPVDLTTVVRDAVEVVQPAATAKGVRIQLVAADGCVVHGDPDRLRQIVWNLISNGVKFTAKGGRVQVILRRINSHVEVVVSDTGVGIPPEVLPYVFDRFRQADASTTRRHGGLGLGLAIVRHLVELHGGLVVAESEGDGKGASFTVSLPVPAFQKPQAVSEPPLRGDHEVPAEAPMEELDLTGLRVLLVEDDPDSRFLLAQILSGAGARVTSVATSPEALEAQEHDPPDILVSDIEMPGEDGYTLIRKLRDRENRDRQPRTPAVAVTAYATGEYRLRALRAGFQSFVAKPVNPAELVTVVASTAGRI